MRGVGFPIKPGGSWQGEILLDIPIDIYPSLPKQISPIIHQKYSLNVSAVTEGNIFTKTESKCNINVMVGQLHPNLKGFLPPQQSEGQPYVIKVVENLNPNQYNQFLGAPMVGEQGQNAFVGNTGMDPNLFQNAQQPEQYLDDQNEGDNWARQQMQQQNN